MMSENHTQTATFENPILLFANVSNNNIFKNIFLQIKHIRIPNLF